jgi:hypothetical protein
MDKLHSRSVNFLRWSEYQLVESGVCIREKDIKGIREISIDYDRIGKDAPYHLQHSAIAILALILFLLLSAATATVHFFYGGAERFAWVFWLAIAAITFLYYMNSRREGFQLRSDFSSIFIICKRREIQDFLCLLMKKKEEFIEQRVKEYLSIMEPSEGEKYLLRLREGAVLTNEQYQGIRLKSGLDSDQKPKVGF